ncbi:Uncharacterised protein [Streptococcus pneumoniae]|nr:Uncharacterised protein [Streptococcus pneumoniae]
MCARSLRLKRFKSSNRIQLNPLSFLCKQGTCAIQFIFSPAKCFNLLGNLSFSLCLLRSNIIRDSPFQSVQVTRQSRLCARSLRLKRFKSSNRIQPNPLGFLSKRTTCASISQSFLSLALSFFQWPVVKAIKALIDSVRQFLLDFFSFGLGKFDGIRDGFLTLGKFSVKGTVSVGDFLFQTFFKNLMQISAFIQNGIIYNPTDRICKTGLEGSKTY